MSDLSSFVRTSSVLIRLSGVLLLVAVAMVYGLSIQVERMPPSHPWSGITLTLFGVRAAVWPVAGLGTGSTTSRTASVVLTVLPLVSGALWAVSALG